MSKHEEIVNFIISLDIGTKISVRGISSELGLSDGTAYRAIKEAENMGIVKTVPRVGTVRVDKVDKKNIESLTYAEVINILDATILGGKKGINRSLNKFIIGAMAVETIHKYISPGYLLIVGNREEAQELALENEAAVLITGGFNCSEKIKALANEKGIPVLSSSYDTFTVASMINKAIYESMIKKEIISVEDVMEIHPKYLSGNDTVATWRKLMMETNHERYPVVDENMKLIGIVTLRDLQGHDDENEQIYKVMSKDTISVTPKTTVAYAAHIMGWDGIKLCPVVNKKKLVGVLSIEDVIKAMEFSLRQPQVSETIEDLILKNFKCDIEGERLHFNGQIIPQMLDPVGTASWSSLNMLLSTMGIMALRKNNNINISVDSIMAYFMKPVQMGSDIDIYAEVLDKGRSFSKVEISMYNRLKQPVAKAMISAKTFSK
ncbi:CBS domain-containing protein [Clostridium tagluense]|uniref:DRTGG domain-containing protein n=1 Tax=Clostridium tagluense TaxID=360422 RepID=UPI001CF4B97C|nr:DRTGG domain-containing protein [Clostridium tagluense]MCB2313576.1 CBS domain-containing protein [Clostridium tagluense]MCB2318440.1 CBS domain-containing protein [Clostridium tagluense]MCB2323241.1 CBS domain-containing protein [Clostridium tagluense]MCB2328184.1 CBS domain-containing protein [Clostridium tagluense]MCB2332951.1 CBS domain-containing protein [Clostridium tagluense]